MKNALTIILIIFLAIASIGAFAVLLAPDKPMPDGTDSSIDSNVPVDSNNGDTDGTIDSDTGETDNTVDSDNDKKDETVDSDNNLVPEEPDEPEGPIEPNEPIEPDEPIEDIGTYVNSSDCEETIVVIEGVEYKALTLEAMGLVANAYYFSEKAGPMLYEGGDATTANKFFATKTFTLPTGSVIWVEDGWQYRPEGWVFTGIRPSNTMCTYVTVNETWWETYDIRGFNIMRVSGSSLANTSAETVYENFKIYIPVDRIIESEVA